MIRKKRGDIDIRQMRIELESINSPASLAKSHKIIRTENIKELLFLQLCKQIDKNANDEKRSSTQRLERKLKRR